nr:MAG TPA: protein of unknown function DUF859 [Caudoviricetes sp.]
MVYITGTTVDGVNLRLKVDVISTSVRTLTSEVKIMVFAYSDLNDPIKISRDNVDISILGDQGQVTKSKGTSYSDYLQGKGSVLIYDGTQRVTHLKSNGQAETRLHIKAIFTTPKPGGTRTNEVSHIFEVPALDVTRDTDTPWFILGKYGTFDLPSLSGTNRSYVVKYQLGKKSGTVQNYERKTITWLPPLELAEEFTESYSAVGTFIIETHEIQNGQWVKLSDRKMPFTVEIPDTMRPEVGDIVLTDQNDVARALLPPNVFVGRMSEIQVNCPNVKLKYGATIKQFTARMVNNSTEINDNGGTFPANKLYSSGGIEVTVTDSRGMTSWPKVAYYTVLNYERPSITFIAYRTKQDAKKIQVSRYFRISPLMYNGKQLNKAVLKFKSAPSGTNDYTEAPGPANGEWNTIYQLTNSAANLSPDFTVTRSYDIRAELSDIFTENDPTISSYTVGPELVIHAYDSQGRFGAGKIPDHGPFGSVDIQGRFYSQGELVQHKQITDLDGTSFTRSNNKDVWDFDNFNDTGIYHMRGTDKHNPLNNDGILECWKMNSGTNQAPILCFQRFTSMNGNIATRYSYGPDKNSKGWGEWTYSLQSKQLKPINDDANNRWKTANSSQYHYKVIGDVVYFTYNFLGTGGNMVLYEFPRNVFVAPESMMFVCTAWSIGVGQDIHFQINANSGHIHALGTVKNNRYAGMLILVK